MLMESIDVKKCVRKPFIETNHAMQNFLIERRQEKTKTEHENINEYKFTTDSYLKNTYISSCIMIEFHEEKRFLKSKRATAV